MGRRDDLADCLAAGPETFRRRFPTVVERYDLDARTDAFDDGIEAFDASTVLPAGERVEGWTRELVWRLWLLDDAPVGLTLSGPAYQDNPIQYVNRTFRDLTGYSLEEVLDENPRFLQGPDTEPGPVADLREATDIWERVTVELRNYRRDGTPFRNRVSLAPITGPDGSVTHWLGIQRQVGDERE
ncbi:PAS domain-containing protein [Halomicrobium katesii]|uniref:PAS domain-containing protein n=1 Tax=Halomicrobium katesii TaxID=437163 RepID=UPI00037E9C3B|nr:PAS domain-containing protein [Halomicrobium katesii]